MGVAIGLALEAYRRPKNPAINFRKDEFAKENSSFKKFWGSWGFYINLAAASIAIFFVYSFLRNSISEDLTLQARRNMKSAASSVFQMKKQNVSEQKLSKIFNDLEKRELTKTKIIEKTQKLANAPLTTLRKISEKASSRSRFPIDIATLKINSNLIEIKGATKAKSELTSFTRKLKTLAAGKVNKKERVDSNGITNFTISFKPKKGF